MLLHNSLKPYKTRATKPKGTGKLTTAPKLHPEAPTRVFRGQFTQIHFSFFFTLNSRKQLHIVNKQNKVESFCFLFGSSTALGTIHSVWISQRRRIKEIDGMVLFVPVQQVVKGLVYILPQVLLTETRVDDVKYHSPRPLSVLGRSSP